MIGVDPVLWLLMSWSYMSAAALRFSGLSVSASTHCESLDLFFCHTVDFLLGFIFPSFLCEH